MTSPVLAAHFERLKARYPSATLIDLPSGAALISVPSCGLPPGWSQPAVTLRIHRPQRIRRGRAGLLLG